jgi:phosphocarrier protein
VAANGGIAAAVSGWPHLIMATREETQLIQKTVQIRNRSGLHARPASLLVQEASRFQSRLTLRKDDKAVDLKSILGVMSLAVMPGETVVIEADGPDETQAVERLTALIDSGLGEGA